MSETTAPPGLFDRALRRITTVWRDMADRVSSDEDQGIASQMLACLDVRGGEVSARNRAAKLAQAYLGLNAASGRWTLLPTFTSRTAPGSSVSSWEPTSPARAYGKVQR